MEIISRLSPKHQSFELSSSAYGGLTQSDIAYSLAGLDKISVALVRSRALDDPASKRDLIYIIYQMFEHVTENTEYRAGFVRSLYRELIHPLLCKTCNGTGHIKSRVCPRGGCDGGRTAMSNCAIARSCGMDESTYRGRYKAKYEHIYSMLLWRMGTACGKIKARLK